MGNFDLDFSHLRTVVAPDRIPVRGNEHRITRVAFDLFRIDEDREHLWQVQADDDGNEFLVRTYELPKEDALQAKSEWSVVEDGKKASLTVVFCGMPVHRLVASEYGARTPEEVGLLRDLLQTKLAEDEFAGRFIASMPGPKRAALAALFPKFAAQPLISSATGNDPLEGIEPMDPKKEYGIDPAGKSDLPPPGEWAKRPQMAKDQFPCWRCGETHAPGEGCGERDPGAGLQDKQETIQDPWREQALPIDMGRPSNRKEAKEIVPKVLTYLRAHPGKKVSLQTLYTELDVNDIPLYLALHALVKGGLVHGMSPYDAPSPEMAALTGQSDTSHADLFYSVGKPVQNADE